jgi:hypothetical protein
MPALAYHRSRNEKRAVAPPGDYRSISSRRPLVAIHLSPRPANLTAIGFAPAVLDFGETRRIFDACAAAVPSAARHFARGGGRYVETSHPPPAAGP